MTAKDAQLPRQQKLEALDARRGQLRAGLPQTVNLLIQAEDELLRRQWFWDHELPAARVRELQRRHDYALRPPMFDPVRGTRAEADERWHDHCRALTTEARRRDASFPAPNTDLATAIRRSIAFQLLSCEYTDIAQQERPDSRARDHVRMSVRRFCALVKWNLRPARRGHRHVPRRVAAAQLTAVTRGQ